ncbi:MAG: N(G),N(G)-dimethylarginine dimethylaminohydrolase [Anaerolineales bacterium]|nr:N(G),N(G)-dimethylarginine dimethylaminohydrolase [Anaerolineales bacterium]
MIDTSTAAAYGGAGWSPRAKSSREEIGEIWGTCGVTVEWSRLKAVLLHRPGPEMDALTEPNALHMLDLPNVDRAREQHDAIAQAYREAGVAVHDVEPNETPPPNLMFVADLMFMTPEGAIVGRPASTVRAGEERFVARRLADLGIPILRTVHGAGTFEGADAMWMTPETVLLATGLRTNPEGAAQVTSLVREMGADVVQVGLSYGTMHLMGQLRFADRDLAIAWPGRVPFAAVDALRCNGYEVLFLPDEGEAVRGMALNFVTLGPREILMAAGNPITQTFYADAGITCHTVEVDQLLKAAGGIGCLTGILERSKREPRAFS